MFAPSFILEAECGKELAERVNTLISLGRNDSFDDEIGHYVVAKIQSVSKPEFKVRSSSGGIDDGEYGLVEIDSDSPDTVILKGVAIDVIKQKPVRIP